MAAKKNDDFFKNDKKENVNYDKENVEESMRQIDWGKSLEFLPTFTIRVIEKYRDESGKQKMNLS